jgi:hypothetical protein
LPGISLSSQDVLLYFISNDFKMPIEFSINVNSELIGLQDTLNSVKHLLVTYDRFIKHLA